MVLSMQQKWLSRHIYGLSTCITTNSMVYDTDSIHSVDYLFAFATVVMLSFIIYHVAFELARYKIKVWMSVAHVSMQDFSGSLFVGKKTCNTNESLGRNALEALPTRDMKWWVHVKCVTFDEGTIWYLTWQLSVNLGIYTCWISNFLKPFSIMLNWSCKSYSCHRNWSTRCNQVGRKNPTAKQIFVCYCRRLISYQRVSRLGYVEQISIINTLIKIVWQPASFDLFKTQSTSYIYIITNC
jgi:hypothetical protein